jgi:hypothetical protein
MKALDAMQHAAQTITQRGKDYDNQEGERSVTATVAAFNCITGCKLDESDGWLFMLLLKQVRQYQKPGFHEDSAIDSIAYAALLAESLSNGK